MKLQQFELVADLRDFLSEQVQTCTVTNYRLVTRGPIEKPVNDYAEIKTVIAPNSRNVQLVMKRGRLSSTETIQRSIQSKE